MSCTEARDRTGGSTAAFVKTDTEHVPRWPNFFDGRVLTAEVMRSQREAVREHLRYLGLAVGPGIVQGLTVALRAPTGIDIAAGTAINGAGDVLHLDEGITLTIPTSEEAERQRALFAACRRGPSEEVSTAVYVLTARPCDAYRGRDPRVSNGTGGTGILGCGYKWLMEGIAFELLELPSDAPQDLDDPRFHNLLAFWCYHGNSLWHGDLWRWREGIRTGEGGVEGLTEAHVPLAVVAWDGSGIAALDMWAARREPGAYVPVPAWSGLAGTRPARLGRARFLGFQSFLKERYGASLDAAEFAELARSCRFLPPAWVVQVTPETVEELSVDAESVTPEEARLAVERSFLADPIDLDAVASEAILREHKPAARFFTYRVERAAWGAPFLSDDASTAGASFAASAGTGTSQTAPWFLAVKAVRGLLPSGIPTWAV